MLTLKHQLLAALLVVLPTSAYAQQAPTTDDSGPVSCPPGSSSESGEACPPETAQPSQPSPPAQPIPQEQPAPSSTNETSQAPSASATVVNNQPVMTERYPGPWLAISVGGGGEDFAGSAMRHATNVGGSWNARLTIGTHSRVAAEISYIGSAQSIAMLGELGRNTTLVGNGAQGVVRLNGTIDTPIQPFVYAGAAYRHYSTTNNGSVFADLSTTDNVLEVPAGGGLAAYFGPFMVDVRGEYRWAFPGGSTVAAGNPTLDRWGASGNFGFEF
jgi:hypothetical protein